MNMKSVHLSLISAIVACVFLVDMYHGTGDGKNESSSMIITAVSRRRHLDIYFVYYNYDSISRRFRCEEQESFMVEERTCMKNENLLEGI